MEFGWNIKQFTLAEINRDAQNEVSHATIKDELPPDGFGDNDTKHSNTRYTQGC